MAICIICGRKKTRGRVLSITTKICAECTNNIKENNYILTCDNDLNARNSCSSTSEIGMMSNENNESLTAPSFNNNENFINAIHKNLNQTVKSKVIKESQSNCEIKSYKRISIKL